MVMQAIPRMALVGAEPAPQTETFSIGGFEFTGTGVTVHGHPTRAEWEGVFDFVSRANKYSGFWMVDLIAYVDSREDWADWRDHAISAETGLTFGSVQVYRSIGKSVPAANRVDGVAFGHHMAVAPLASDEQVAWLEKSKEEGWTKTELVAEIRAAKRVKRLTGASPFVQQLEVVLHLSIEAPTFTKAGALAKAEIARLLKPHTATILEAKVASVRART